VKERFVYLGLVILFSLPAFAKEKSISNKLYIFTQGIELINQSKHLVLKSVLNETIRLKNFEVSLIDKNALEAIRVVDEFKLVYLLTVKIESKKEGFHLTVSLFDEKNKTLLKKLSKPLSSKSSPMSDISSGIRIILKTFI